MGGVAHFVSDAFHGATDFLGDVGGSILDIGENIIDETLDLPGDLWRDPLGTLNQGFQNIGKVALAPTNWTLDIGENLGERAGIKELHNIMETGGDIFQDPRVEGLTGAVVAAYASPYAATALSDAIGAAAPSVMYSSPALMEAQLAGTVAGPGMMSAAASNLAGMAQVGLSGMAAADPFSQAMKELAKGGTKLAAQEGIKEFVLDPMQEDYLKRMSELQAVMNKKAPNLLDYGYTPQQFYADPTLAVPGSSILNMPQGTMAGIPDIGPAGGVGTPIDYAKLPDLWNYLGEG